MKPVRQPLLHAETVAFRAPTQVWSAADGSAGTADIHGYYHSDVRLISSLVLSVNGEPLEHIATVPHSASEIVFVSLARHLDDTTPDPGVRGELTRSVRSDGTTETLVLSSRLDVDITTEVCVSLTADATGMDTIKSGLGQAIHPEITVSGDTMSWGSDDVRAVVTASGASVEPGSLTWSVVIPAHGSVSVLWSLDTTDALAAVGGAEHHPVPWSLPTVAAGDERLARWMTQALQDLDALRLTTTRDRGHQFLAAGAPWFFTLFGRDSIWAARMMLPLGTHLAEDTLRILADLQGREVTVDTAEEPGKIMHELRRVATEIPEEGVHLPPLYFGTVDATPLWVCLLHDAWRWGMPDESVRSLLPHLRRALAWMRDSGDSDGDGLLEYVDHSGRGLSNQGWKDSGDSVQWRDGTLADGPIALCEVQAYAYEAAIHGADVLDALGVAGEGDEWRLWGARVRERFHEKFWIDGPDGAYVAIALDAQKRPVDTVTSNMGHLLGTGLLDQEQATLVAARLVSPELNSGYGLRTMSTDSAGYWPLSYHGGSVWTHDTAIAIAGLVRDGFRSEADALISGLLATASGFDYRMPELHSGDSTSAYSVPVPYPAACRPQAWSAASAVSVLASIAGLVADERGLDATPSALVGPFTIDGLSFGGAEGSLSTDGDGRVAGSSLPLRSR